MKKAFTWFLCACMVMSLLFVQPISVSAAVIVDHLGSIDVSAVTVQNTVQPDAGYKASVEANYTNTDAFSVSTAGELAAVAALVNEGKDFRYKTITLTADINLGGSGLVETLSPPNADGEYTVAYSGNVTNAWTPIGEYPNAFDGTFDGNGKIISNMIVCIKMGDMGVYAGLFGRIESRARVHSVTISHSYVVASAAVVCIGGITGYSKGRVYSCENSASVSASAEVRSSSGGIVGRTDGAIVDCQNKGVVMSYASAEESSAFAYAGGVVGESTSSNSAGITDCQNTGTVAAKHNGHPFAGGIAGVSESSITRCSNSGEIQSQWYTGGIAALSTASVIDCANAGSILYGGRSGGIVSHNKGSISNALNSGDVYTTWVAAGIVADNEGYISHSVNRGSVANLPSIDPAALGGIVGANSGHLSDCLNTGFIQARGQGFASAGGIAAAHFSGDIQDCMNIGELSAMSQAEAYSGGIVSTAFTGNAIISNCLNVGNMEATSLAVDSSAASQAGGIVGIVNDYDSSPFVVRNCLNVGSVVSSAPYSLGGSILAGGIIAQYGNIHDSVNLGNVTATGGSAVGHGLVSDAYSLTNSFFQSNVDGTAQNNHASLKENLVASNYRTYIDEVSAETKSIFSGTEAAINAVWYFAPRGTGILPQLRSHMMDKTLLSIANPSALVDVENGTPASDIELPSSVMLQTDGGEIPADVTWNMAANSYNPATKTEQSFGVSGTVALPTGVVNTNNVPLTVSVDVTVLAAVEEPETPNPQVYTISFNAGDGQVIPASALTSTDGMLAVYPTPTRSGYSFGGWFNSVTGSTEMTSGSVYTEDTTIYAKWTKEEASAPAADALQPIVLTIDSMLVVRGKELLPDPPVAPQIINGRTMLPFRYLIQTLLGGTVDWNDATRTVRASINGIDFRMTIGDENIFVGGDILTYGQAPVIVDGYTLVPLRAFEAAVERIAWNATTRQVEVFAQE